VQGLLKHPIADWQYGHRHVFYIYQREREPRATTPTRL